DNIVGLGIYERKLGHQIDGQCMRYRGSALNRIVIARYLDPSQRTEQNIVGTGVVATFDTLNDVVDGLGIAMDPRLTLRDAITSLDQPPANVAGELAQFADIDALDRAGCRDDRGFTFILELPARRSRRRFVA